MVTKNNLAKLIDELKIDNIQLSIRFEDKFKL
jgi:hypothetical protein